MSFCVVYVLITPPFESPDEYLHLDYINFVSTYKALPNQYIGIENPDLFIGQGHQHPLYYILMSIPVYLFTAKERIRYEHPSAINKNWIGGLRDRNQYSEVFPNGNEKFLFYFIRFFSTIFSIVNLYFIFKISALFLENTFAKLLPVIIAASLPQFQFISSVINNDAMLNLLVTVSLYYLVIIIKYPRITRFYIYAAIFIATGILVKKTGLFILPCAIVTMIYLSIINHKSDRKIILKNSIFFLMIALIISSFIFLRNYFLYGELLAYTMEKSTMMQFVEVKSLFSYYFIQPFSTGMFNSFIGVFGWMNIPLPRYIEIFYLLFFASGFIYALYMLLRNKDPKMSFLYLTILACLVGIVYFNLTFTQYQGRYMFPVLSAICVVSSYGINNFCNTFKYSFIKKYIVVIALVMIFIFDIIGVVTLYNHYY